MNLQEVGIFLLYKEGLEIYCSHHTVNFHLHIVHLVMCCKGIYLTDKRMGYYPLTHATSYVKSFFTMLSSWVCGFAHTRFVAFQYYRSCWHLCNCDRSRFFYLSLGQKRVKNAELCDRIKQVLQEILTKVYPVVDPGFPGGGGATSMGWGTNLLSLPKNCMILYGLYLGVNVR